MSPLRRRRIRRGFTILEALMAGVIFLLGATGVVIFASQIGMLGRRGTLNAQMAQVARDEINKATINGLTSLAATTPGMTPHTMPNGMTVDVTVDIFDTGQPAGSELPNQMPECVNLSAPSQCIRVTVQDSTKNTYKTATYVLP